MGESQEARIARLEERVSAMKDDLTEMKGDVKANLVLLQDLSDQSQWIKKGFVITVAIGSIIAFVFSVWDNIVSIFTRT